MTPYPNDDETGPRRMPAVHDLRQFLVGIVGGIPFGLACLTAAVAPGSSANGLALCQVEGPKRL